MTAIVETQIRDLKAMAEIQEVGKTLVYVIVPRKSAKWYIGKAATSRVWAAGRKCEGLVIRSLEHLAGATKGGGRTQEGVKYKCWKNGRGRKEGRWGSLLEPKPIDDLCIPQFLPVVWLSLGGAI